MEKFWRDPWRVDTCFSICFERTMRLPVRYLVRAKSISGLERMDKILGHVYRLPGRLIKTSHWFIDESKRYGVSNQRRERTIAPQRVEARKRGILDFYYPSNVCPELLLPSNYRWDPSNEIQFRRSAVSNERSPAPNPRYFFLPSGCKTKSASERRNVIPALVS